MLQRHVGWLFLVAVLLIEADARADIKEGRYRQGALKEDFTVQQWLAGCGPSPQSTSTGGGETVTVKFEGDELSIVGGGRVFRTNQCYDQMPTLTRKSHSASSDKSTWRSQCVTPENDPRKATLNTLVSATSDHHIEMIETGRYEVVLDTGRCLADVKRTRSFELISDDAPVATTATATTAPPPKPTAEPKSTVCDNPGDPSRLEVRPSKKLLRTGESFKFNALVLDDKGCATRTAVTWKTAADGKGVTVDANGTVKVAGDAPEGPIEIIVSTAANKETRVTVEVTQPSHYDELLARSGLNASGENDQASSVSIGTQSIAGEGKADDKSKSRRVTFIAIIGAALAVLAVLFVIVSRRAKKAKKLESEVEERHQERLRDALERREKNAAEHAAQQRAHEESLKAAKNAMEHAKRIEAMDVRVCPSCGRQQRGNVQYCPVDGTSLVPISRGGPAPAGAAAGAPPPPAKRGKICPTCGDRSDGGAEFCGKDGTQLVLLN